MKRTKGIVFMIGLLCFGGCLVSQNDRLKPQETEVWHPEPTIITSGVGTRPPSDALVLFDGYNLDQWERTKDGSAASWTIKEGYFQVTPGSGGIRTKEKFGSVQLHLEWKTPVDTAGLIGQQRGNSGVFLQEVYEVQILDSYQNRTYSNGQAGSVYKQHIPLINACRPPGEWQVYDIFYTAPVFDQNDRLITPAYVTVIHNGILIQNHVEIQGETTYQGLPKYNPHKEASLMLQDHGNPICFRNIWIRRL